MTKTLTQLLQKQVSNQLPPQLSTAFKQSKLYKQDAKRAAEVLRTLKKVRDSYDN